MALIDAGDDCHAAAAGYYASSNDSLLTHNYVVVETISLVQRRLGGPAVRLLVEDILPDVEPVWIGEDVHRAAEAALLSAPRRRVSLVDWVSFEVMRREGIDRAFAFDRDFAAQGFETLP